MADPDLETLQRWMSSVVRHPRVAATAVRSKSARRLIPAGEVASGNVVLPSATMQPCERLDVYGGGYLVRLCDALRVDFPALVHALGDGGFAELARGYVERHPSQNPNLTFFCRHLPEFVAGRRNLQNRTFLRDLCRLELAMVEAFHAPAFTPVAFAELAHLDESTWAEVVLRPNPSLRLCESSWPVNRYAQAVFDGQDPAFPPRERSRVAVYRKDYQVWRAGMGRAAFGILEALAGGLAFGPALRLAGDHRDRVGDWFQDWAADGLFSAAILPDSRPGAG